jgi:hypothetical protein
MDISSLLRKPKKDGDYKKLQQVHFIALIPLKATLRRNFYAEMCMVWPLDGRTWHDNRTIAARDPT